MKLSKVLPIYTITDKGIIIGDTKANLTASFKLTLPTVFTPSEENFRDIIEDFRRFIEGLGDNIMVHKQDFFYRDYYSLINSDEEELTEEKKLKEKELEVYKKGNQFEIEKLINEQENFKKRGKTKEFLDRAYNSHFNERVYFENISYLHISKMDAKSKTIGISKEFADTDEDSFLNSIINGSAILEKNGIKLELITQEELTKKGNPFSRYYNFQKENIEQLKDVDFSNNKVYVGGEEIKIYSVENLKQFPTDNIPYSKSFNGLPVSNMFHFSFPLSVPHLINQYIYVPGQKELKLELDKKRTGLEGYNYKGSNNDATEELYVFSQKMEKLSCKGVYFHYNVMCFDDDPKKIEKEINLAFSNTNFKKKTNSLTRKDLFLAGIPSNSVRLALEKDKMMSLVLDLEATSFLNLEQNYKSKVLGNRGSRLCDRIYGIPFNVDVFDKKINNIKNENVIVLSGSGGGKSYTMNLLLLNDYQQGSHIFCIDASFSYRIQCAMHNGVYLTFDEKNKIEFNPFYMKWLKEEGSKKLFQENVNILASKELTRLSDMLEERINTIMGVISAIVKGESEIPTRFEEIIYRNLLYSYFKDSCINETSEEAKFDHFYEYAHKNLKRILKENQVADDFNANKFLMMLQEFKTGNSLGYLLNSTDQKVKNLTEERFIVIDVSRIRENALLFSIVSILAMDLYNQKVNQLPLNIKKNLVIDEAWQAISSPRMATFMKAQVKVIRKYGGRTIFISQELDDFISSEIIQQSVINNSAIKIFADMGEFKQKFEPIKKTLSISDSNEQKIKSLNTNNRKDAIYKEICICWEQRAEVYAVETPLELKAIFETEADEVVKILPYIEEYGVELTAINYADNEKKNREKTTSV